METYRLSSKLNQEQTEYLIQTVNDTNRGAVSTMVYVNGALAETINCPHPAQVKPEEVLSLVKLAHTEKKKELETLLQTFRRVMDSGNAELMYQLGTAFYYKSFYTEARELFGAAAKIKRDYHQAINYLGLTELELGNIEQAINSARDAVQMRPGYADYLNNLGEALLSDNRTRQAIEAFERAIGINMYYSEAYFNLGLAHTLEALLHPQAMIWEDRLARIKDNFHKAALIYAEYRTQEFDAAVESVVKQDLSQALTVFKKIRELRRETSRRELAAFYMKLALFPEWASEKVVADRIQFLEREINRNPTYVDLQAELSLCYLEQARMIWQKGVEQYRKTHELNPSLRKVRFSMEEAEKTYEDIGITLRKITEQG
ncbi:MAG: tetratricopeptide repeat protein [Candidatus Zixiibacteriota bacterium]|jgi:tetratricopeptide (TPR) repeat protein